MERVLERNSLKRENGEQVKLEYFLVTGESGEGHAQDERTLIYGIGIRKAGTPSGEQQVVKRLTGSEEKARKWIRLLARNRITPLCLAEVLEEMISEEGI